MGSIYLVRHGQASFGSSNYDQLSTLGYKQSHIVGEFIYKHLKPTMIISGSMQRHRQTAEGFIKVSNSHLIPQIEKGFNEFNHEDVVACMPSRSGQPRWTSKHTLSDYLKEQENPQKAFHQIFITALEHWLNGDHDQLYKESWPDFRSRVILAIKHLMNQAQPSQKIVIFTSGGPIAAICQWLLGLDNTRIFAINENLVNGGITHVRYNRERASLSFLNNYTHLEQINSSLITYR